MRSRKSTLTDLELEIMKVVWDRKSTTVRDVYEILLQRRKIAYTTVMTMMKILEQKKYLTKEPGGDRAFIYQARQPQEQIVRGMVREFVNRVFNGSAQPLLVHLLQDRKLTEEDLDEITRQIREGR